MDIGSIGDFFAAPRRTHPIDPNALVPDGYGVISANRSRLTSLPLSIFVHWPNIKLIYLEGNFLSKLPSTFFDDLPLLAYLDLRNNKLEELPGMKFIHENLRVVLLQNNLLKTLPPTLTFAKILKILTLKGNPLDDFPELLKKLHLKMTLAYLFSRLTTEEMIKKRRVLASASETQLNLKLYSSVHSEFDGYGGQKPSGSAPAAGNKHPIEFREPMLKETYIDEIFKKKVQRAWHAFGSVVSSGDIILKQSGSYIRERVSHHLKMKTEEALQRMKDKDALHKWRMDTSRMKFYGLNKEYLGLEAPFANENNSRFYRPEESEIKYVPREEYLDVMGKFSKKVKEVNSLEPTGDLKEALARLKQLEDIYREFLHIKLKVDIDVDDKKPTK